jgi:two-component system response regulator
MNEYTKKLNTYVGMRLSEKRKARRLTLTYLAQRVNISPQQLQKYECAQSMMPALRLYQLATVLQVDVNYFFNGFSDFEGRMVSAPNTMAPPPLLKPLNILLIERDENDAYRTRRALENANTSVNLLVMRKGPTVLRFLRNQETSVLFPRPDLILLGMPHSKNDGLFLLRELKRDQTLSDIPIVVLANSSKTQDIITCYAEHATSYVCKPFKHDVFEHMINTLLSYWAHAVVLPNRHAYVSQTSR